MSNDIKPVSYSEARECLYKYSRDNYIFRGQENANWPLLSRLGRLKPVREVNESIRISELLVLRKKLLNSFRRECVIQGLLKDDALPLRDMGERVLGSDTALTDLESLAQHYGLPTCLLDWSLSPYVALLFAFGGHNRQSLSGAEVAVWCLSTSKFKTGVQAMQRFIDGEQDPETLFERYNALPHSVTIINRDLSLNHRVRKQRGYFTYMKNSLDAFDTFISANSQYFPENTLTKIIIDGSDQVTALSDLKNMGLTPGSLFEGFDAVASDIWTEFIRFDYIG